MGRSEGMIHLQEVNSFVVGVPTSEMADADLEYVRRLPVMLSNDDKAALDIDRNDSTAPGKVMVPPSTLTTIASPRAACPPATAVLPLRVMFPWTTATGSSTMTLFSSTMTAFPSTRLALPSHVTTVPSNMPALTPTMSTTTAASLNNNSFFHRLPIEIRVMVYRLVLPPNWTINFAGKRYTGVAIEQQEYDRYGTPNFASQAVCSAVALIRSCKTCYLEMSPVLYGERCFHYTQLLGNHRWTIADEAQGRGRLRTVQIRFHGRKMVECREATKVWAAKLSDQLETLDLRNMRHYGPSLYSLTLRPATLQFAKELSDLLPSSICKCFIRQPQRGHLWMRFTAAVGEKGEDVGDPVFSPQWPHGLTITGDGARCRDRMGCISSSIESQEEA